jgi:uncharacterized repeat protein (TIGR02543 family)
LLLPSVALHNPATDFQLEGGDLVKATGMMVYNTSNELKGPGVYLWNGVNWGLLTPQWQFSVSAQTGGSVSGSSSGTYDDNATVNVTASANTGYTFNGWYESGTRISTSATYSFTITDNRTIEARFTINTYTFSRSAGTGGTVSGTANGTYNYNVSISVTATASTGYTFDGWYEGSTKVSSSAAYSFRITANRIIQARFTINTFTFSRSAGNGGTVSGTANGTYNYNTSISVTASSKTGHAFDGWYSGSDKLSSSATYSFTLTANVTLTAMYTCTSGVQGNDRWCYRTSIATGPYTNKPACPSGYTAYDMASNFTNFQDSDYAKLHESSKNVWRNPTNGNDLWLVLIAGTLAGGTPADKTINCPIYCYR